MKITNPSLLGRSIYPPKKVNKVEKGNCWIPRVNKAQSTKLRMRRVIIQ